MRVAVFTWGLWRAPHLAALLGADEVVPLPATAARIDAVAGWGRNENTRRPRRFAERHGLPFLALEDGWFRSYGHPADGAPALSMVVDDLGVHYDPGEPSRLERILAEEPRDGDLERARACLARIRAAGLGRTNDAARRPLDDGPRVLVVRQPESDPALRFGAAAPGAFDAVLEAAIRENDGARVYVLDEGLDAGGGALPAGVTRIGREASPQALVADVDRVYVQSSSVGFHALLAGTPVTTFGAPFYAGWGLTDDRAPTPRRRARTLTVEALFAGAALRYARYVDPETGERCEAEALLAHLALQREAGPAHLPRPRRAVAVGFTSWKRSFLPSFLRAPGREVRFAQDARTAEPLLDQDAALIAWGARPDPALTRAAEARGAAVWRMEDGFLRSVGLGSDLNAPASLALDPVGIYYDPSRPSALEALLQDAELTDAELARARALRERIVEARISKYNVGFARRVGPPPGDQRAAVLAIGQVEDDASIQLGCVDVRRNEDLLREARIARPDAFLMYKPHPDVVSGNRVDDLPLHVAAQLCDEVVIDAALADCLDVAEEVHTMTSLVGFEALLRGKRVVCYGQPFYSGWGLTEDRHPHPRRTRRRGLDELVACALLRYPTYVHPISRGYTTPERIVDHLERARRPERLQRSWAGRQLARGRNYLREMWRAS